MVAGLRNAAFWRHKVSKVNDKAVKCVTVQKGKGAFAWALCKVDKGEQQHLPPLMFSLDRHADSIQHKS